jgi:hypothetical protein
MTNQLNYLIAIRVKCLLNRICKWNFVEITQPRNYTNQ